MRKSQKRIILGETYGSITVLSVSKAASTHNMKTYLCKCEKCKNMFEYDGSQIIKYQDQGCPQCREALRNEDRIKKTNSYSGAVYGNLKIIKFDHFGKNNVPVVQCECLKCGNFSYIPLARIKCGQASQCSECAKKNLAMGKEIMSISYVENTNIIQIHGERPTNKNSTTGVTGVSYYSKLGKYRAYIFFKGKQYHLGIYSNMEDAIRARKSAEKEVFGNFLKWYQETYPEQWERIQKSQEKKHSR